MLLNFLKWLDFDHLLNEIIMYHICIMPAWFQI